MNAEPPSLEAKGNGEQSNQLRFIIDVTLRHWVMIAAFTTLATILGATLGNMMNQEHYEYEAFADLFIRKSPWERPVMQGLGAAVFGPMTPRAMKERTSMRGLAQDIVLAMVQNDVAGGARWSNLASDQEYLGKAAEIEAVLSLEDMNESGVLRIRTRSDDRQDATRVAEYAARILIDHTQTRQYEDQEQTYLLIKQQLDEVRQQLDEAESQQWAFREAMGFQTHDQVWQDMERKNRELLEATTAIEETQAKVIEIEAALQANSDQLPRALGNVTERVVQELLDAMDTLRQEQLEMSVVWQPDYPELVALEDEIAEKKQAVLIAIDELDSGLGGGSGLWTRRQDLYRQKLNLDLELTSLGIRKATLRRLLADMVQRLPELADQSFLFERMAHEATQIREQFNRLLTKEFEVKSALKRGSATVERRDAVVVIPSLTGGRSPMWASVLLGALLGFIIGFGLAMMLEMMDTSIRSVEDVNQYIQMEVIGMIPMMKFGKPTKRGRRGKGAFVVATDEEQVDACIVTQHDPKSPISEAYRSLRTNFQFATIKQKPRTVMVTSAVPGEGKTTTAVNFAVTMADRGMRVLIVDTDLRRPNVHRVLKMERGPGLADVLRERIPVKNVIRPTRVENLWIISSGRVPPNPSELIGSERMKRLMIDLGQSFDLVVCDAPSILVVTDPVLLATHVDTVTMVVSVNNARRETVQRAKKLMETASPHIAGVVLNGLEATRRHYYYYYYYYDDRSTPGRRRWYHNI